MTKYLKIQGIMTRQTMTFQVILLVNILPQVLQSFITSSISGRSAPPSVPPKDYSVRNLPPLPEDPVPPPRRKRSIAEFQNIDASR